MVEYINSRSVAKTGLNVDRLAFPDIFSVSQDRPASQPHAPSSAKGAADLHDNKMMLAPRSSGSEAGSADNIGLGLGLGLLNSRRNSKPPVRRSTGNSSSRSSGGPRSVASSGHITNSSFANSSSVTNGSINTASSITQDTESCTSSTYRSSLRSPFAIGLGIGAVHTNKTPTKRATGNSSSRATGGRRSTAGTSTAGSSISHDNDSSTSSICKTSLDHSLPLAIGIDIGGDVNGAAPAVKATTNPKRATWATGNSSSRATGGRRNTTTNGNNSIGGITTASFASLSFAPRYNDIFMSPICKTNIRAPLANVAALLLDTRTHTRWDKFCRECEVTGQPRSVTMLPSLIKKELVIDAIANLPTTLRDGTSFTVRYTAHLPRDYGLDPLRSHYLPKMRRTSTLQVSVIEQIRRDGRVGLRIAWCIQGFGTSRLMGSERFHELVPSEDDPDVIEMTCWQTYSGPLAARAIPSMQASLGDGFAAWMDGLRTYAEGPSIPIAIAEEKEFGSLGPLI